MSCRHLISWIVPKPLCIVDSATVVHQMQYRVLNFECIGLSIEDPDSDPCRPDQNAVYRSKYMMVQREEALVSTSRAYRLSASIHIGQCVPD